MTPRETAVALIELQRTTATYDEWVSAVEEVIAQWEAVIVRLSPVGGDAPEPQYYAGGSGRNAVIELGFGLAITVRQGSVFHHPLTLEAPTINWPSPGGVTTDTAEQFAAAILKAAEIAREWDADTGKATAEVLQESNNA